MAEKLRDKIDLKKIAITTGITFLFWISLSWTVFREYFGFDDVLFSLIVSLVTPATILSAEIIQYKYEVLN